MRAYPEYRPQACPVVVSCLALGLTLAPRVAFTDESPAVDTSEWVCNECPFEDAAPASADVDLRALSVSDPSARFGRYSGLDDDGVYPALSGTARRSWPNGRYLGAELHDVGLDAMSLELRGGQVGRLDLSLGYRQQPNHWFDTTRSPFAVVSGAELSLPATWVRGINTRQMPALGVSLRPVDTETERHSIGARLRAVLGQGWSTYADYEHRERNGTWRTAASFGFSALELPKPIDDLTQNVGLGVKFASEKLTARLGYDGSFYSNRRNALSWSNPYLGPARGQLAQAPDNAAQQLQATVGYRWSERTALSAVVALGALRQDDAFLPYSINAQPLVAALPRASLDGEVRTTHLAFRLTSDLEGLATWLSSARFKIDWRYDERDNRTPVASYAYVVTDQFTSAPTANDPYSFRHQQIDVSGDYDLRQILRFVPDSHTLKITGGWRHDDITRTLQEARDSSEDTGWGRLTWRPAGWLDLAIKWGGANREIDRYQLLAQIVAPQNPLLRKYNMADRERQFSESQISWRPSAAWNFIATGRYANDNYINSPLGLRGSRENGATFAGNWAASDKLTLFADYAWQRIDARQSGSAAFSIRDWFATSRDRFRSANLGLRLTGIAQRWDVNLRGFFANSAGDTLVLTTVADALPTVRTRANGAEAAVTWRRDARLSISAALRYDHFDADDYALDGVLPATLPALLSLGAAAYDHDIVLAMVSFRYALAGEPRPSSNP